MKSIDYTERIEPELLAFIAAMPKAEIHVHLEGTIRPATLLELAAAHGATAKLPSTDLDALAAWFTYTGFPHFLDIWFAINELLRTPADFETIVYACGADMAEQNIRYRELTFTPYTHTHLQRKGLGIDDLLAALDAGRRRAAQDFGVEMRWVFDIPRGASFMDASSREADVGAGYDPAPAEVTLAYALQGQAHGVVGFGLGGFEVGAPPEPFAHAFAGARAAGLLSAPHAGETMGAESVRGAVEALGAQRIGHGVRAMEDPALLALLKERQIVLEVNPTSNICLGVYRRAAEHPLPHLERMGLCVTLNSDDPPLFNTTLVNEYALAAAEWGYDRGALARLARNAYLAAGVEEPVKEALLAEFDAWAGESAIVNC